MGEKKNGGGQASRKTARFKREFVETCGERGYSLSLRVAAGVMTGNWAQTVPQASPRQAVFLWFPRTTMHAIAAFGMSGIDLGSDGSG